MTWNPNKYLFSLDLLVSCCLNLFFVGKQGLWLHFLHPAPRSYSKAGSPAGLWCPGRSGVQGRLRRHVEGKPDWAQWRTKVSKPCALKILQSHHDLSKVRRVECLTVVGVSRSLVALSLILAMLLFKPAPIYILDEVDAALDLSHTQNIGQMLRTHFRHSQVRLLATN